MEYEHSSDQCFGLRRELDQVQWEYLHLRLPLGLGTEGDKFPRAPRSRPYARKGPQNLRAKERQPGNQQEALKEVGKSSGMPATPENPPMQGGINVIAGGPTDGDSN